MQPLIFFKSLADETRLVMLLLISEQQELCVCELTTALGLSQPKISRHLALLKSNEILVSRRQGQWVYYSLAPSLPNWCLASLHGSSVDAPNFFKQSVIRLTQMGDRPQRQQGCCN